MLFYGNQELRFLQYLLVLVLVSLDITSNLKFLRSLCRFLLVTTITASLRYQSIQFWIPYNLTLTIDTCIDSQSFLMKFPKIKRNAALCKIMSSAVFKNRKIVPSCDSYLNGTHYVYFIVFITLYTLYYMHCIICIIFHALYSIDCILSIDFYALYSMHYTQFIVLYAVYPPSCILGI